MSFGVSAFGTLAFGGQPTTASAAGVTGSGSVLLMAVAAIGAALLAVSGAGLATASAASATGAGHVNEVGAASSTLTAPTASGAGLLGVTGAGSGVCAAAGATGNGAVGPPGVSGTGSALLAAAMASGAGLLSETGSGSLTNPALSASGFGTVSLPGVAGAGSSMLGAPSAAGAGLLEVSGACAAMLGPPLVLGTGQVPASAIVGSGTLASGSSGADGIGLCGPAGINGDRLQGLIYRRGYAMAANKAGLAHQLFRATGPFAPLDGPALGVVPALFSQDNGLQNPNLYGNAVWHAWLDGTQTEVGDILVGPRTFFIVAQQPLLPILAVEAPRLVDIRRPFRQAGFGFSPTYGGDTPAQETTIMQQWPASILQGMRGDNLEAGLPDDQRPSGWSMLLPASPAPPVLLLPSDVVVDELGRRYTIASAELTSFGWRLNIHLEET